MILELATAVCLQFGPLGVCQRWYSPQPYYYAPQPYYQEDPYWAHRREREHWHHHEHERDWSPIFTPRNGDG